jgi:hypothetical protein
MSRTTGNGEHTYEWISDWAKLPAGVRFGYTHGVAEDAQGRIYIHSMSEHAICVFDGDGRFIESWGSEFAAGAHGLTLNREGNEEFLYLSDIARKIVVKTTLNGEALWSIAAPMDSGVYQSPEDFKPTNVAALPSGAFYVADGYGQSYIHQYNAKAEYVRTWGGPGEEPGKLRCPHGITVDTRGPEPLVLVADRANVRLQYFTLDGTLLPEKTVTRDLLHPCHFSLRNGELLVPDLHGRVSIFNRDNDLVCHLGITPGVHKLAGYPNLPHAQRIPGRFISPHAAMWDAQGNIYVVEWIEDGRVIKLIRKA